MNVLETLFLVVYVQNASSVGVEIETRRSRECLTYAAMNVAYFPAGDHVLVYWPYDGGAK